MSDQTTAPAGGPDQSHGPDVQYAIRVRGHLADRWSDHFDGFVLSREADGTTVLTGRGVDQSALHGVLSQLADLGLHLLSVNPTPERPDAPDASSAR